MYARHGRSVGGESPLEEAVVLTPSQRQRRRREAESEGSPRQNPAPRNTNRIEGGAAWVSQHRMAKPVTTKGSSGRCGGGRGKVIALIRGGLSGCPKRCPVTSVLAGWERDGGSRKAFIRRREVSRGHSTGGEEGKPGRAERQSRGSPYGLEGETKKAANPEEGPGREGVG